MDTSKAPETTQMSLQRSQFYKDQKKEELTSQDKGATLIKGEDDKSNESNGSSTNTGASESASTGTTE